MNLDFNEEELNSYNIAFDAILININEKAIIKSKLFNGVNILDYQISYENKFEGVQFKNFDRKILYNQFYK